MLLRICCKVNKNKKMFNQQSRTSPVIGNDFGLSDV